VPRTHELAGGGAILLKASDRVVPIGDVEQALVSLHDVRSARVVADDRGGILEIHVVAGTARSAKQVARDVGSLMVAKLGFPVDHRKISVALVDDDEPVHSGPKEEGPQAENPQAPAPARHLETSERRVEFVGVSVAQSQNMAEARVELALGDGETVASVAGADAPASILRSVSEAVIKAIQQLLDDAGLLAVNAIEQVTIGGTPIVVTAVIHVADRQEKQLIGACAVNGDPVLAAALATLDAVNRYLRRLRRKVPTEYEIIGPASETSVQED